MRTPEEKEARRAYEATKRASLTPEEIAQKRAYKKAWADRQSPEWKEKQKARLRETMRKKALTRTDEERAKRASAEASRRSDESVEQREKRLTQCRNVWHTASPEKRQHMLAQHRRWNEEQWAALTEEEREAERVRVALESRKRKLKRNFDLTLEAYDALLNAQGGCCAICRQPPDWRALAVDHDHKTGKIRGILCYKCNVGIGMFDEDLARLAKVSEYLKAGQTLAAKVS